VSYSINLYATYGENILDAARNFGYEALVSKVFWVVPD
jgi:hypothetical protein